MSFFCPHCNTENGAGTIWEGMTIRCPLCLREIVLEIPMGPNKASETYEGYAVTFRKFCAFMEDRGNMPRVKPMLEEMLNCSVKPLGDRFILKRQGALIPLEIAHLIIQSDPEKQRKFYNLAMSIWKG